MLTTSRPDKVILIRLSRAQAAYRRSDAPFRGFVAGRGSGKTVVGAYDLLRRALPGYTYTATSPTYTKLEDEVIHTVRSVAKGLGLWRARLFKATPRPCLRLPNGAAVRFRSTDDPDSLRGPNLSGFWMDEAGLADVEAYRVAIACLREKGSMGWLAATFTPKGRTHWTYEVFGTGGPNKFLVHSHTRQNKFLPPGFADTIAAEYGGPDSLRSRQELGGEFVQVEGAEWPPEYFPDSVWFDAWPPCQVKTMALDPSKGKSDRAGDYAAWVMLGRDKDGGLWCEADLIRGKPIEQVIDAGVSHFRTFCPEVVAVEGNQWQELVSKMYAAACQKAGLTVPVKPYHNLAPKDVRIRRLGPLLARRLFRFRDTPGTRLLVAQLMDFPEGEHDDGPDGLEMALRLMIELTNARGKR